ncbi:TIGR00266 family protein [Parafrankia sp. EUN1f]|uniref:TIGR00266 family protein n=1 Tax=Parafrankia sp. EUN1f TaxID=102897 RepID=UPI0001C468C8|nr:TIGR00266 family protein [Parafrankia sp. EUN1f]EFC80482.1 protein of unknown function DUF124 [Parafrankia sp. EUN1f]
MQVDIRHSPSFAVARLGMAPGETVRAESGAMMAHADAVTVESSTDGGLLKGLKRSVLGGESLFITRFTAGAKGGWVDVAANLPGDVCVIDLGGSDAGATGAVNLARGAWLSSSDGVELETAWGGFKNLAGGEGGFLVRATGAGKVVASCYGAIDIVDIAAGTRLVLDSGHLVAFSDSVSYTTRKISSGLIQSLKSGERLVFEFTGPGRVWTQSRNPKELVGWLTAKLPFSRK